MTRRTEHGLRGLYLVTPDEADDTRLVAQVEAALRGGPALLQYRNKLLPAERRHTQAAAVLALCRAAGVPLVVNDSVDLALAIGADGVHLGRDDGDPAAARARLGTGRILGVSCYDEWARAEAGARAGADYVAFGAMFASPTKPAAVRAPLELLGRARRELGVAVAAIGGITVDNAPQLVAAGADLLAVISDVFAAADPAARATAYGQAFRAGPVPAARPQ
ncbi:thiamine phosphate synthase [Pseudothauera rhizosphaerae]|uniref:Thiamine-phosphate synthase n=1 Tax=Pseudothauera rhizosphaerae TaxID=2565932 RepID=A0A4S4ANU8_9RHOO|nr:thiamine phosphate synthase [Pseudothauera rhizosphaerae]THF61272.1 thiamine phosphate synthase [Pseudothauera rhizosphaerae]